jgi:GAF domain-containing protein
MFGLTLIRKNTLSNLKQQLCERENDCLNAIRFAKDLGNKNTEVVFSKVPIENRTPLAKALVEMRRTLMELLRQEGERSWIATGLSKVGEIVRTGTTDTDLLTNSITSYLIKYINAHQGCLFILNDAEVENPFLEMKGLYAYDRSQNGFYNKRVELTEGLVGQCYKEGEIIHLHPVPENYSKIMSGLGAATPSSVALIPLKSNEKKVGVLEIMSFSEFGNRELDFLKMAAETICSTLINTKSAERTAELLRESQSIAKQLKRTEEELKLNLAELLENQDIRKKNQELQEAKEEIEKQKVEIELIQHREMALVESKLETQKKIYETIINKLKARIAQFQNSTLTTLNHDTKTNSIN